MAASRSSSLPLCLAALAVGCLSPSAGRRAAAAPSLTLAAADGSAVTLEELGRGREAAVLVFWSAGCPCVRRYQERVDALLETYPADRVRVVAVSSNAGEPFAESLREARARGTRVPLYRDEGGLVARALGARSTPTVAVLDASGEVRFLGWIDNERLPGDPRREPWLDRALRGVLEGRGDFAARTPTYGCPITRSLRDATGSCCSLPTEERKTP